VFERIQSEDALHAEFVFDKQSCEETAGGEQKLEGFFVEPKLLGQRPLHFHLSFINIEYLIKFLIISSSSSALSKKQLSSGFFDQIGLERYPHCIEIKVFI
jgi:hypothetical protein